MGSNLNVASITLNSSTDFVLQQANAASRKRSTIFSDFGCTIHYLLLAHILKLYAN